MVNLKVLQKKLIIKVLTQKVKSMIQQELLRHGFGPIVPKELRKKSTISIKEFVEKSHGVILEVM